MKTLIVIFMLGIVLNATGQQQNQQLKENKMYFLLGTLKHSKGDQRSKIRQNPKTVQTYSNKKLAAIIFEAFREEYQDLKMGEDINGNPVLSSEKLNKKIDTYFQWNGYTGTLKEEVFQNDVQRRYFIAGAFGVYGFMTQDTSLCMITFLHGTEGALFEKLLTALGCEKVVLRQTMIAQNIYFTPTEALKQVLIYSQSKPLEKINIPEKNMKQQLPVVNIGQKRSNRQ